MLLVLMRGWGHVCVCVVSFSGRRLFLLLLLQSLYCHCWSQKRSFFSAFGWLVGPLSCVSFFFFFFFFGRHRFVSVVLPLRALLPLSLTHPPSPSLSLSLSLSLSFSKPLRRARPFCIPNVQLLFFFSLYGYGVTKKSVCACLDGTSAAILVLYILFNHKSSIWYLPTQGVVWESIV